MKPPFGGLEVLILTLDEMEKLHIGADVTIQFERRKRPAVVEGAKRLKSRQVQVRIDAPEEVFVIREELDERGNR
ncbi:hypothetical protein [Marinobacter sp. R17]|uniref:hypothetical protein n=1 Tax=Marinobacter sp. R17 TaxID=2484250 RepID=UPI000F4C8C52|nr:hypothetical protein [Marinobacter sp. R17]